MRIKLNTANHPNLSPGQLSTLNNRINSSLNRLWEDFLLRTIGNITVLLCAFCAIFYMPLDMIYKIILGFLALGVAAGQILISINFSRDRHETMADEIYDFYCENHIPMWSNEIKESIAEELGLEANGVGEYGEKLYIFPGARKEKNL